MLKVLALLISAVISGMGSRFKVACVCGCLVKGSIVVLERKRRGNRLLCPACSSFGGESAMAHISRCCGLGGEAPKGSALVCELLAQNLLSSGSFYKIGPPKRLSCPWQPSSQTSSRALSDLTAAFAWLFPQSSPPPS